MHSIPKDQKRAISDYRCAARKLAKLLADHGKNQAAERILNEMERTTREFHSATKGSPS